MLIHNPKQHKSIALKTRRHQHEPNCGPNQTGELWRDFGGIHWRVLASRSGSILAGYSAGSGKGYSAGCGIHWQATLGYSAGYSALVGGIHWRATLGSAGHSARSTGELLWRDTWRDPLASYSGILSGILGGIHWRAALVGYSAGSTGEPLWQDTRRYPLASRSGGIPPLGGIDWREALAGYWARSTGEQLWQDTHGGIHWQAALAGSWVGAWCRSIANADSNIKSNNPFLSGGEKHSFGFHLEPHPLGPRLFHPLASPCRNETLVAPRETSLSPRNHQPHHSLQGPHRPLLPQENRKKKRAWWTPQASITQQTAPVANVKANGPEIRGQLLKALVAG